MAPSLDRVYDDTRARAELGWQPRHDFATTIARARSGSDIASALTREVGRKGYHGDAYRDGLYPVARGTRP